MALATSWLRYGDQDRFLGYLAMPRGVAEPLPAVIVIQEIWGVDGHIEDVTRRVAHAGYVAFAPDCFAVDGRRPDALAAERLAELLAFVNHLPPGVWGDAAARDRELAKRPSPERERLDESFKAVMSRLSVELNLPAVRAASEFLRAGHAPSRGQGVCAMGFCLGGALAAALACHDPALRGAVVYYGGAPAEVSAITCPVLGFYGETDKRLVDALPAVTEAMKKHGKRFEPHVFPGAGHAFFNDERPSYQVDAARQAWARTLAFLAETLGAGSSAAQRQAR